MKILYIANITRHFIAFHEPYFKRFNEMGNEVHILSNGSEKVKFVNKQYDVDINRSPFSLRNIKVILQVRKIIIKENYDIIHGHTPMGGVLARIAPIWFRKKPMVIYTSHGFNFCKNGPILNWILFYPIEFILAQFTDVIFTINQEDYRIAKGFSKNKSSVYYTHGVGINLSSPMKSQDDIELLKLKLDIDITKKVLLSVGELTNRKNHMVVLKALKKNKFQNYLYLICGTGKMFEKLTTYINKHNLNVKLLGYKSNIEEYYHVSDIVLFPSKLEGLGMAGLETLYFQKKLIASSIHGINDYAINKISALTCKPNKVNEWSLAIENAFNTDFQNKETIRDILKKYKLENSIKEFFDIYTKFLVKEES